MRKTARLRYGNRPRAGRTAGKPSDIGFGAAARPSRKTNHASRGLRRNCPSRARQRGRTRACNTFRHLYGFTIDKQPVNWEDGHVDAPDERGNLKARAHTRLADWLDSLSAF